MQRNVGAARLVYGIKTSIDHSLGSDLLKEPEFIAIWANKKPYIFNYLFFDISTWNGNDWLPEGSIYATQEVERLTEKIKTEEFKKFYDSLDTTGILFPERASYQMEQARKVILLNNGVVDIGTPSVSFGRADLANILCGFTTLEECAKKNFSADAWVQRKAENEAIAQLAETIPIEDWERDMAAGLYGLDAKYILVEFTRNGIQMAEKISPSVVQKKLIEKYAFHDYDFASCSRGENLVKTLCPHSEKLTCEHITKITYGRKALFQR